jgi:hypothetical protein
MQKMGADPEKGLPSRDDCQTVIGHIMAQIRGFGEVLQAEEAGGPELRYSALVKLYNNLVDALIVYLQQWSANRDHECSSVTKLQYDKADVRAPLNGNIFSFNFNSLGMAYLVFVCKIKY